MPRGAWGDDSDRFISNVTRLRVQGATSKAHILYHAKANHKPCISQTKRSLFWMRESTAKRRNCRAKAFTFGVIVVIVTNLEAKRFRTNRGNPLFGQQV